MSSERDTSPGTPEENFVTNMRLRREQKGWSQADLAEALRPHGLDLHRQTIQKIESGLRPVKLNEAHAIADALEDHVEELVNSPVFNFMVNQMIELDEKFHAAVDALVELYSTQERVALLLDEQEYEPTVFDLEYLTASHETVHEVASDKARFKQRRSQAVFAEMPEHLARLAELRDPEKMGQHQRRVFDAHSKLGLWPESDA